MKIGVVADDITGSNDIGLCFAKGGAKSVIYTYEKDLNIDDDTDVAIIDTDSRLDTPQTSYEKVSDATRILMLWGANKLYKKTCSVFRGNIGPEFDAMQDAAGLNKSMVVLGFPKNGRTTVDGIHYVNGIPLSETHFANDPIHPMTKSNLTEILSGQTNRNVYSISYNEYGDYKDPIHLYNKIQSYDNGYLIFDVRNDDDLIYLANVLKYESIYCGSSALGEYLPGALNMGDKVLKSGKPYGFANALSLTGPADNAKGVLIAAGSLTPQTAGQIEYAKRLMRSYKVNTISIFSQDADKHKEELTNSLVDDIVTGQNVILYTANSNIEVKATKEIARQNGLDDIAAGKVISDFLSDICKDVLNATGAKRFIALGGDTSAAITRKLDIKAMYVGEEIDAGIPTLVSKSGNPYFFVLKSGSFGSQDFIMRTIEKLNYNNI